MNRKRNVDASAADERLEQLLDEELRAMAQAPPVKLRAKVMEAIEDRRPPRRAVPPWRLVPAWTFGAAAAAILLLAVIVGWPGSGKVELARRTSEEGGRTSGEGSAPGASQPAAGQRELARRTSEEASVSGHAPEEGSGTSKEGSGPQERPGVVVQRARRAEPGAATEAPVLQPLMPRAEGTAARAAAEPYLPGAPSGNLGDPLAPLPGPNPISIVPIAPAPIVVAPPVSENVRPVVDFPADSPPDASSRTTGETGGRRR